MKRAIDLEARREMARLMRRFARGGMTVDEFEKRSDELAERDHTVHECQIFAWYFYCDFKTERLEGKWKLTPTARTLWAKWVLFLMASPSNYEGPDLAPSLWPLLLLPAIPLALAFVNPFAPLAALGGVMLLTKAGVIDSLRQKLHPKPEPPRHWPFPTEEEYATAVALKNPFAAA